MRRERRFKVLVSLTLGREAQHLMVKDWPNQSRLVTACGMAPYYDGIGRRVVVSRDGRKVKLLCKFCRDHLHNHITGRSYTDQGNLFDGNG